MKYILSIGIILGMLCLVMTSCAYDYDKQLEYLIEQKLQGDLWASIDSAVGYSANDLLLISLERQRIINDKAKTGTRPVRNFNSLDELRGWLDTQGIIHPMGWDCVDYAIDLQQDALEDGYLVNFTVSENYYYNWFFTQFELAEGTHAYNSVIIGDKLYYIEPMNHEISRTGAFLED